MSVRIRSARLAAACGVTAAAALAGAPSALASVVTQSQNTLGSITWTTVSYQALNGETNTLTVSPGPGAGVTFTDTTTTIVAGAPCVVSGGGHTATCPGGPADPVSIDYLEVDAADRDDTVTVDAAFPIQSSTLGEPVQIDGGTGNDRITGSPGGDRITAGAGNDTVDARGGSDTVLGQAGDDRLDGGDGVDDVEGGDGADTVTGGAGEDYVDGGGNADDVGGGPGDDAVYGDDVLDAQAPSNDTVHGDAGNDRLTGDEGDDVLDGGEGDDYVAGAAATGPGSAGADVIRGGPGIDEVDYRAAGPVNVTADGAAADDGESGEGDNVAADVEVIDGSPYDDAIVGNATDNRIDAGEGDDFVDGAAGQDTVLGGPGADTLYGGDGNDVVDAGSGADAVDGGPGDDRLLDGLDGDPDRLDGGDGEDVADYSGSRANLRISLNGVADDGGPAEGDDVLTEDVLTGSGSDVVTGAAGRNVIDTGDGDDVIGLRGDAGVVDDLSCGAGIDAADVDASDAVARTGADSACETVNGAPSTASPAAIRRKVPKYDTTPPKVKLRVTACGPTTRRLLKRGCTLTVTGSERVRVVARLTARTRRGATVVLASRTTGVTKSARQKLHVRLRPDRALLTHTPRRYTTTLRVVAYDRGGNPRTVTRKVRLRRG